MSQICPITLNWLLAKTMTNNLPILSVLAHVLLFNRLDINYSWLFFFIISIS